jgi:hypothetical protein
MRPWRFGFDGSPLDCSGLGGIESPRATSSLPDIRTKYAIRISKGI